MRPAARFCIVWAVALVGILVLVAAFNALMDPYLVIGAPRIAGINLHKEHFTTHHEMVKTYEVERYRPVTVLLGTSRVDVGLDPADPDWPKAMRPVFNYGIGGTDLHLILANLREAAATGRLRNAYILLDFELFFSPDNKQPTADTRRLLVLPDGAPNPHRRWRRAHDLFLSTLTLHTLEDSVADLLEQRARDPIDIAPDGYPSDGLLEQALRSDGARAMFLAKGREYTRKSDAAAAALAARGWKLANLDEVREIVAFCRGKGIRLTLMLPPYDAGMLRIFRDAGLGRAYAEWKHALKGIAAASNGTVALWDFSDPTAYTAEAGPRPGERDFHSRYFWEYAHFKKSLGGLMIARMTGHGIPGFGVLVK